MSTVRSPLARRAAVPVPSRPTDARVGLDPQLGGANPAWRRALLRGAVAYVVSRAMVVAAAGVVTAGKANALADIGVDKPTSAGHGIIDVLTSWDGLWYLSLVRDGYPRSVPPHVTYFDGEARAAFFPLYSWLVRGFDVVFPGHEVVAALGLNLLLGAVFVLLCGVITRRLFGDRPAGRAMMVAALFPGSFVLSFAYSEALFLVLAAACLLFLLRRWWWLAGIAAALSTLSRPNAIAIVPACLAAAVIAIHQRREWRALVAPALAPIGFVVFQLYVGWRAGERGVWFRVQRQAWREGTSFGFTAIRKTVRFATHPLASPTNVLTALCLLALVVGIVAMVKVRLPLPLTVFAASIILLTLLPETVTARPRFVYTAFPMIFSFAAWWPDDQEELWGVLMAMCGAGLVIVTALYGHFAAIP